jgi:hypothetical protein
MKQYMLALLGIFNLFYAGRSLAQPKISITIPKTMENGPLNGRLLLLFSTNKAAEPRFQIEDGQGTQQVFGMDVQNWQPGTSISFDSQAFGYPVQQLKQLPKGQYQVQVVFHKYEVFNRADGHKVLLPMDRGEGQHWNLAPGNLLSTPTAVTYDPDGKQALSITLNSKIPPVKTPEDTKYIKHIRVQSKLLTAFWGRPMYLGAHILLPEGWDTHPNVHYPLAIYHGHFPDDFGGFRTTPPDPDLKPDYSARFDVTGYNKLQQQEAYDFYKMWTGPGFPRVIAVEIQHPTPFYDDSYAVNSANNGPYGDAIVKELIPEIEKQFRGIGQGWARFMYGGSTGGWEAFQHSQGQEAGVPRPTYFRMWCEVVHIRRGQYHLLALSPPHATLSALQARSSDRAPATGRACLGAGRRNPPKKESRTSNAQDEIQGSGQEALPHEQERQGRVLEAGSRPHARDLQRRDGPQAPSPYGSQ